jgi:choline dehydrogenase-like flavoprotein
VSGVRVQWRGQLHTLRAPLVVLAAGALQTPLILLRSESPDGRGLGNGSDQVGRHLMRHFVDLMQFKPARRDEIGFDNRRKEIAFSDFYADSGERLGTVQSFGRLPPPAMLFGSLVDDVRASPLSPLASLLPLARPFIRSVLEGIEGGHLTLASIVEDLPYPDHRVTPDGVDVTSARMHYTMKPEALRRVQLMRTRLKDALRGRPFKLLPQAANNQRVAHACGTCRFGDDPRSSVLDRDNRVHDVDNLFVVDSSFFPSSGGTNPSLTIAANALRVGERIAGHLL